MHSDLELGMVFQRSYVFIVSHRLRIALEEFEALLMLILLFVL